MNSNEVDALMALKSIAKSLKIIAKSIQEQDNGKKK